MFPAVSVCETVELGWISLTSLPASPNTDCLRGECEQDDSAERMSGWKNIASSNTSRALEHLGLGLEHLGRVFGRCQSVTAQTVQYCLEKLTLGDYRLADCWFVLATRCSISSDQF